MNQLFNVVNGMILWNKILLSNHGHIVILYWTNVDRIYTCSTSWLPIADFMTRNNLANHLSWLLDNIPLTKPPCRPLPTTDAYTRDLLKGRLSPPSSSSQTQNQLIQEGIPPTLNAKSTSESLIEGAGEIARSDDSMGRLTSSAKSKKPSLVSQAALFPTPLPTLLTGSDTTRLKDNESGNCS